MAKPRVFISSTYYDLKTVRSDLERFVKDQGYDPILFERGHVAYGKDQALEEYCHKEVQNCDILVSIIGGKIGSASRRGSYSISQVELRTALESSKQVYVFVERDVLNEYRTYSYNKDKDVRWQSVDDNKIFEFIAEVYALPNNNQISAFDTSSDIVVTLREQWAGLFQRLLSEGAAQNVFNLAMEIRQALDAARKITDVLAEERSRGDNVVQDILLTSHPIFSVLRNKMRIPYRVFFTDKRELDSWLDARGFKLEEDWAAESEVYFEWHNRDWDKGRKIANLQVAKSLFDSDQKLKTMHLDQWEDFWIKYNVTSKSSLAGASELDDDVPF